MTNVQETIWIPVPGFEGLYNVSNTGLVMSLSKEVQYGMLTTNNILRPLFNKDCYLRATLLKNNHRHDCLVHRLVALAFMPNPDNLPIVDHGNGVRWDNRVDNLKWSNQSNNVQSAFDSGRKVVPGKSVDQFDINGNFIKRFEKAVFIERDGFNSKRLRYYIITGKPLKGFIWKYSEDTS